MEKLDLYDKCIYHIVRAQRLQEIISDGGSGQLSINGNWKSALDYLEDAKSRGQNLLILFDHADRFIDVNSAAIITEIQITKTHDSKYITLLNIAHLTELDETFEHSELVVANTGEYIPPSYRRGYVLCLTPEEFEFYVPCIIDPESDPSPKGLDTYIEQERKTVALDDFEPSSWDDARKRAAALIVRREGQPQFRQKLIEIYHGKCAISGYDVTDALQAAHIRPYLGPDTNSISNGLLLRADIHTLFDLQLLAIDSNTMKVVLSPRLKTTSYKYLHDKEISLPNNKDDWPDKNSLDMHREQAKI